MSATTRPPQPRGDEADAALAAKFLESLSLSPYNTRLFKSDADGSYTVRLASAKTAGSSCFLIAWE